MFERSRMCLSKNNGTELARGSRGGDVLIQARGCTSFGQQNMKQASLAFSMIGSGETEYTKHLGRDGWIEGEVTLIPRHLALAIMNMTTNSSSLESARSDCRHCFFLGIIEARITHRIGYREVLPTLVNAFLLEL